MSTQPDPLFDTGVSPQFAQGHATVKLIAAIDPGIDGAIVILDGDGHDPLMWVMPSTEIVLKTKTKQGNKQIHHELDLSQIRRILLGTDSPHERSTVAHVFIEKQQPNYKPQVQRCPRCQIPVTSTIAGGIKSTFQVGRNVGLLEGLIAGLKIPYTMVAPQNWQPKMLKGVQGADSKAKATIVAESLFPGVDKRRSLKGRKPHEGICDALVLCEFGRRMLAGEPGDYDEALGF